MTLGSTSSSEISNCLIARGNLPEATTRYCPGFAKSVHSPESLAVKSKVGIALSQMVILKTVALETEGSVRLALKITSLYELKSTSNFRCFRHQMLLSRRQRSNSQLRTPLQDIQTPTRFRTLLERRFPKRRSPGTSAAFRSIQPAWLASEHPVRISAPDAV
jgi:hypothetical protein